MLQLHLSTTLTLANCTLIPPSYELPSIYPLPTRGKNTAIYHNHSSSECIQPSINAHARSLPTWFHVTPSQYGGPTRNDGILFRGFEVLAFKLQQNPGFLPV